jgi:hypothetical protein
MVLKDIAELCLKSIVDCIHSFLQIVSYTRKLFEEGDIVN